MSKMSSGARSFVPKEPNPPAFETVAVNRTDDEPSLKGPRIMGYLTRNSHVKVVSV